MCLNSDAESKCPECFDVIADKTTRSGKSPDDIADSLQTDVAMEARVECAAILIDAQMCGCCLKIVATGICLNCSETLCADCTVLHGNMSVTRHHKVVDQACMTADDLALIRQIMCSYHPDQPSRMFCDSHKAAVCLVCVESTHRHCYNVRDLKEKMKEAHDDLAKVAATLKAGESKLELSIEALKGYLCDIKRTRQATLDDIDSKFDRLSKYINDCRQRLKEEAEGRYSVAEKTVEAEKAAMLKQQRNITSHKRLVDRVDNKMPLVCGVSDLPSTLRTTIRSLDLHTTLPAYLKDLSNAIPGMNEKALKNIERELCTIHLDEPDEHLPAGFRFHTKHGSDIELSLDQAVAERITGDEDSIVISADALESNILYEVRLDTTDECRPDWTLPCGVTVGDPEDLTLPTCYPTRWSDAVVIGYHDTHVLGLQKVTDVGNALRKLRVGSRLGVLVDSGNKLHLYIDGQDQGVAATRIRRPCHAFFGIRGSHKKISTLPLRIDPSTADQADSATDSDTY